MAPAFSPFGIDESPEEDPEEYPEFEGPSIAAPPLDYAPTMAPAYAPFFAISESPEEAPAGAPEAEATSPSSEEMAAAPSSGDYDVLDEEVLAPEGAAGSEASSAGPDIEESPASTATAVSKAPAPAAGPSADVEDSGASTIAPTRRSLVAAVVFATVCAVAAS
ncbi:skin secretory protein xP2-like [Panicum hallii]|nr:skin secretory protein xP2-like [Panicum hallii]